MARTALAGLASGPLVALLILGYLAAHFALRLLTSPTLGLDDAEQALLAQHFAWGYQIRQPPLYTWLLLPAFDLLGPSRLALSLVRYLLLGLTYGLLYGVARRWLADRRLAALAVFSYAAIYLFGYYAHHDLTHTTALAAAIAASFYAFVLLVERQSVARYLLLGLCFGLGLLAKWNFVMLALSLPLACLLDRRLRPLVLDPKVLLALGAMALVTAPAVLWVLNAQQSALGSAGQVLAPGADAGFWPTLARGSGALIASTLVYPLPFLALFLLAFGRPLWRGIRTPVVPQRAVGAGFLGRLIALTLALHWLLIPTVGATAFTEHWLHPALMILPVWLFALLEQGEPTPGALRGYLGLLGVVVVIALGARTVHYVRGADHCGRCRDLVPFEALAGQLRAAGFVGGTIVTDEVHIGGNLRLAFPKSRVINPAWPVTGWPPARGRGQCLAVWQAEVPGVRSHRRRLQSFLAGALQVAPDAPRRSGRVVAPMIGSETRSFALGYELLTDGSAACR